MHYPQTYCSMGLEASIFYVPWDIEKSHRAFRAIDLKKKSITEIAEILTNS